MRRLHSWPLLLPPLLAMAGCSAIFSPNPPKEAVEQWLANVPPPRTGEKVYELLRREGFSPRYEGPASITGHREEAFLLFADWLNVSVELDDAGIVMASHVYFEQNYP